MRLRRLLAHSMYELNLFNSLAVQLRTFGVRVEFAVELPYSSILKIIYKAFR